MEDSVFEKIDVSEWGTQAVVVEKADCSVRICINYKTTLNPQLQDIRYPMPSVEDIFAKMENGKVFCKIDLQDTYLHVPVDEVSSKCQAITTHKGTYCVKQMYYGNKVATNIFQEYIDKLLLDLPGTVAYFDDIMVQARTIKECEQRLRRLFEKMRAQNLHINLKNAVSLYQK